MFALIVVWLLLMEKVLFLDGKLWVSGRDRLFNAVEADIEAQAAGSMGHYLGTIFGYGPGYSRQILVENGIAHRDLHSAVFTLTFDYGFPMAVFTAVFVLGAVVKIADLGFSPSALQDFKRWSPPLMVVGIFFALGLVSDVIAQFEMLLSFILSLAVLNSQPRLANLKAAKC
jgi:hypothetical protein